MSVKVEGRLRPFNDRGMKMGAKCRLERNKQQTIIRNWSKFSDPNKNKQTEHTFSFDYSIWSFEHFKKKMGTQNQLALIAHMLANNMFIIFWIKKY